MIQAAAMIKDILIHETVTQIKQAVASEAFDSVEEALADYRRHVESVLADWPADASPPVELAQQANELMQWALQTVRCSRARTRDDLQQVAAALGYHDHAPGVHTWKVDG
jgi:hypothetical protein